MQVRCKCGRWIATTHAEVQCRCGQFVAVADAPIKSRLIDRDLARSRLAVCQTCEHWGRFQRGPMHRVGCVLVERCDQFGWIWHGGDCPVQRW